MGVHGLWRLLDSYGQVTQPESWRGRRVAVDASIWIAQFRAQAKSGPDVEQQVLEGFLVRILKLLFYGIQPIFVFDGQAAAAKSAEHRRRQLRRAALSQVLLRRRAQQILMAQVSAGSIAIADLPAATTTTTTSSAGLGAVKEKEDEVHTTTGTNTAHGSSADGSVVVDERELATAAAQRAARVFLQQQSSGDNLALARRCRRGVQAKRRLAPDRVSKMLTRHFLDDAGVFIAAKKAGEERLVENKLRATSSSLFMGPRRVFEAPSGDGSPSLQNSTAGREAPQDVEDSEELEVVVVEEGQSPLSAIGIDSSQGSVEIEDECDAVVQMPLRRPEVREASVEVCDSGAASTCAQGRLEQRASSSRRSTSMVRDASHFFQVATTPPLHPLDARATDASPIRVESPSDEDKNNSAEEEGSGSSEHVCTSSEVGSSVEVVSGSFSPAREEEEESEEDDADSTDNSSDDAMEEDDDEGEDGEEEEEFGFRLWALDGDYTGAQWCPDTQISRLLETHGTQPSSGATVASLAEPKLSADHPSKARDETVPTQATAAAAAAEKTAPVPEFGLLFTRPSKSAESEQGGKQTNEGRGVGGRSVPIPFDLLDLIELLDHCGIAYVLSPAEADAQCAKLAREGLVDAVFTEDSDVVVHGAPVVLRGFFAANKHVVEYRFRDLEVCGVDRRVLVALAYLLGCDYTEGVPGIGLAGALHAVIAAWPSPAPDAGTTARDDDVAFVLALMERWREMATDPPLEWSASAETETGDLSMLQFAVLDANRRSWGILSLPPHFPDHHVAEAFFTPDVDANSAPFMPVAPNWEAMRRFASGRGLLSSSWVVHRFELAEKEWTARYSPAATLDSHGQRQQTLDAFAVPAYVSEKWAFKQQPARHAGALAQLRAVRAAAGTNGSV